MRGREPLRLSCANPRYIGRAKPARVVVDLDVRREARVEECPISHGWFHRDPRRRSMKKIVIGVLRTTPLNLNANRFEPFRREEMKISFATQHPAYLRCNPRPPITW